MFKIVMVGDSGVGKSQLLNRFVYNEFGLFKSGCIDDALHVIDEMFERDSDFPPDDFTGEVVFGVLGKPERHGRSFANNEILGLMCWHWKNGVAWELLHVVMRLGGAVASHNKQRQQVNVPIPHNEHINVEPALASTHQAGHRTTTVEDHCEGPSTTSPTTSSEGPLPVAGLPSCIFSFARKQSQLRDLAVLAIANEIHDHRPRAKVAPMTLLAAGAAAGRRVFYTSCFLCARNSLLPLSNVV
ncbi:hypothetical protein V8G54_005825 [Vigna mungo]|uniref:Uncharacterized protein n=1 Tax=Vigna mungo TaxID=3915 RepID=A0AAQ3P266_VIGMU